MARPPRRPIRSTRGPTSALRVARPEGVAVDSGERDVDAPPAPGVIESVRDEAMAELEATLRRHQSDISDEDAADLQQQFRRAFDEAADQGSQVQLERSDWIETIEVLLQGGLIDEDESNRLVRQLDAALQPLQRREIRLAAEFSERCKTEGTEKALEWFRRESAKTQDADPANVIPAEFADRPSPAGDSIIRSRSRRLRGPPA